MPARGAAGTAVPGAPDLVGMRDVCKAYPGVRALDRVDFDVAPGEVHALVGLNGAGKSTLVRILAGMERCDAGVVDVGGRSVTLRDPWSARRLGIVLVPQEVDVNPSLSVGRNVLLGSEPLVAARDSLGARDRARVRSALERVGADLDPAASVAGLSVPELRAVQIAAGVVSEGSLLVLDEPTAVLPEHDARELLHRLATLRGEGQSIVLVSHRLDEVLEIADRVTVLRDGRCVGTYPIAAIDRAALIDLMSADPRGAVARPNAPSSRRIPVARGDVVLRVRDLHCGARVRGVDLDVRAGQVVGLAGVQGGGQSQVLRAIGGDARVARGTVELDGVSLVNRSVRRVAARGVLLVPADRRRAGIVPMLGVDENISLSPRSRARRFGFRVRSAERAVAGDYVRRFSIRTPSVRTRSGTLSGGNQQKVIVSRGLESEPRLLLIEEPTQGIDVHGKREVAALLREVAATTKCGILVASSEIEEVIDLADVIYVIRKGTVSARLDAHDTTHREVLEHAL